MVSRPKMSASAFASTIWPRPRAFGLGLTSILLTWPWKMCYPIQNNIGCIHFMVVTLQVSLCNFVTCTNRLCSQLLEYENVVRQTNLRIKKKSVMCCWHCHCISLFRNIYMWPRPRRLGLGLDLMVLPSTSASEFWPPPQPQSFGLGLGVLALFNITTSDCPWYV